MKGHNFTTRITVNQSPADVERRRHQKDAGDAQVKIAGRQEHAERCCTGGMPNENCVLTHVRKFSGDQVSPDVIIRIAFAGHRRIPDLPHCASSERNCSRTVWSHRPFMMTRDSCACSFLDAGERPYQRPKYSNKKIDPARGQRSLRLNCSP
jgi:hypothetical protein